MAGGCKHRAKCNTEVLGGRSSQVMLWKLPAATTRPPGAKRTNVQRLLEWQISLHPLPLAHPLPPSLDRPPPSLTNLHPPCPRGPCSTAPSSRSRAEHRRRLFPHPARFRSWPGGVGVGVEAGAKSPPQAPPRPAANTHRRCCFSSSNRGREQREGETTQSQIRRESHRAEQSTKKNSWCVD